MWTALTALLSGFPRKAACHSPPQPLKRFVQELQALIWKPTGQGALWNDSWGRPPPFSLLRVLQKIMLTPSPKGHALPTLQLGRRQSLYSTYLPILSNPRMPSLCASVKSPFMHTLFSLVLSITPLLPRNHRAARMSWRCHWINSDPGALKFGKPCCWRRFPLADSETNITVRCRTVDLQVVGCGKMVPEVVQDLWPRGRRGFLRAKWLPQRPSCRTEQCLLGKAQRGLLRLAVSNPDWAPSVALNLSTKCRLNPFMGHCSRQAEVAGRKADKGFCLHGASVWEEEGRQANEIKYIVRHRNTNTDE